MSKVVPFKIDLDRENQQICMTAEGANGSVTASMDEVEIAEVIAMLTLYQHALVLLHAGEDVSLPFDPNIAFEPIIGGIGIDYYEVHKRHAIGIDQQLGAVALKLLTREGRLTSIRMSPETAQKMGAGLIQVAAEVGSRQGTQ